MPKSGRMAVAMAMTKKKPHQSASKRHESKKSANGAMQETFLLTKTNIEKAINSIQALINKEETPINTACTLHNVPFVCA